MRILARTPRSRRPDTAYYGKPPFLINTKLLAGAQPIEVWREVLEGEVEWVGRQHRALALALKLTHVANMPRLKSPHVFTFTAGAERHGDENL